jgi:hypothetical protein
MQFAAGFLDHFGDVLPKLAGAEFGVEELLDQRGFGLLLGEAIRVFALRLAPKVFLRKCRMTPVSESP